MDADEFVTVRCISLVFYFVLTLFLFFLMSSQRTVLNEGRKKGGSHTHVHTMLTGQF